MNGWMKKKMSRNTRKKKQQIKEKFGIKIPRNIREGVLIGRARRDNKWGEAITNEMLDWKDFVSLNIMIQEHFFVQRRVAVWTDANDLQFEA
eukprot:15340597-Ditylum_brightwellii.AAC.1